MSMTRHARILPSVWQQQALKVSVPFGVSSACKVARETGNPADAHQPCADLDGVDVARCGGLGVICASPTKMVSALALEISGHEARAFVDERFHSIVGQHFGMVQHRVMRQRLDCGDAYK